MSIGKGSLYIYMLWGTCGFLYYHVVGASASCAGAKLEREHLSRERDMHECMWERVFTRTVACTHAALQYCVYSCVFSWPLADLFLTFIGFVNGSEFADHCSPAPAAGLPASGSASSTPPTAKADLPSVKKRQKRSKTGAKGDGSADGGIYCYKCILL